jgi:tetratricopeptide (TPR) repeat protein
VVAHRAEKKTAEKKRAAEESLECRADGLAKKWLRQNGFNPDKASFHQFKNPPGSNRRLSSKPGSAVLIGSGHRSGEEVGFVLEIDTSDDTVDADILRYLDVHHLQVHDVVKETWPPVRNVLLALDSKCQDNNVNSGISVDDIEVLRNDVRLAELAAVNSSADSSEFRKLADATAELGILCGLVSKEKIAADEYTILLDKAIAMYRDALSVSPNDGVLLNNLGVALTDRHQHSAAIDVLRKAVEYVPEDGNTHRNLAVALLRTEREKSPEYNRHRKLWGKLDPGAETRQSHIP